MKQIVLFSNSIASCVEVHVNTWLQNNPYVKVLSISLSECDCNTTVMIIYVVESDLSLVSNP